MKKRLWDVASFSVKVEENGSMRIIRPVQKANIVSLTNYDMLTVIEINHPDLDGLTLTLHHTRMGVEGSILGVLCYALDPEGPRTHVEPMDTNWPSDEENMSHTANEVIYQLMARFELE